VLCFYPVRSIISGSIFYAGEFNIRTGYHFFSETNSWTNTRKELIRNDVFLRKNEWINSQNVGVDAQEKWEGLPLLDFEWLAGINLSALPGLSDVKSLKGFRGIRAGIGIGFYPISSLDSYSYKGKINYNSIYSIYPETQSLNYNGKINISEELFIITNTFRLYYYHEPGLIWTKNTNKFIPYAGIELGTGIISGNRKIILKSDPLVVNTVSGSYNYKIDAIIQESFMNSVGFKFGAILGGQLHLYGPHYIDLRSGYIIQENRIGFERQGSWNEYVHDQGTKEFVSTYSIAIRKAKKNLTFSQTGFFIMLGYTIGLK
jgi:hypothetical protein